MIGLGGQKGISRELIQERGGDSRSLLAGFTIF
jgi:hypothetical protein